MLKAIFIDMDDTLIHNQKYFDAAEEKLYDYLAGFGIRRDEAQQSFAATDKELFKTLGRTPERLFASFDAVLKHFIPNADAEMAAEVRGFAEEVFTTVAEVKEGVREALALLSQHYPIYIVTAGAREVQERRLALLPFRDLITEAFIVPKKDPALFEHIAARLGYAPEEAVMIGDSIASDIAPAAAAGLQAAWIPAHNSPLHDSEHTLPAGNTTSFTTLLEAARYITRLGTAVAAAPAPQARPAPGPSPM